MFLEKYRLEGKTALITGGGRGIGLACGLALAEAGAKVVIADSGQRELEKAGFACSLVDLDVTQSDQVNAVAPTYIETPLTKYGMEDERLYTAWMENTPMGRVGQPDEIASVVLFLASDAASLLTGSIVVADGGDTCW